VGQLATADTCILHYGVQVSASNNNNNNNRLSCMAALSMQQMDPCDLCGTTPFLPIYTHTHTPFNGSLSGTTRVSRYQKGKTSLDFIEARDSERQWHQLGHMQVCTSLQTDNHASTPPLSFTGRMLFLTPS